jgi:cytochrome c oxidase subunit 4
MILAALTFLLSRAHLGSLDIAFALVIAVAKTVLVVLFFMELIEHRFVNSMVLIVSAGFVVLLVSLTVADILTRHTFPKGPLPDATVIPMSASPAPRPRLATPD